MSKEINNEVMEIKHMAFAVEDIEQSLRYYKDFLGVSKAKRNGFIGNCTLP